MKCIACYNPSLEIYSNNSFLGIPILKCKNCNLLITGKSEEEIESALKRFYESETIEFNKENKEKVENDFENSSGTYAKNLWCSHFQYCRKYIKNFKNLLEIGPGLGLGLRMFEGVGFNVVGIEQNKKFVELINQKLKNGICKLGNIEKDDLEQKFDFIWMSHCYEHVLRPDLLLKKCKDLLKEDGFIFIAVPDCENNATLKESIFDNASSFHYSKKSIELLAKKAELQIIKCESVRELYRFEGRFHMILDQHFNFINRRICPYFPFKITQKNNGREIRVILKKISVY